MPSAKFWMRPSYISGLEAVAAAGSKPIDDASLEAYAERLTSAGAIGDRDLRREACRGHTAPDGITFLRLFDVACTTAFAWTAHENGGSISDTSVISLVLINLGHRKLLWRSTNPLGIPKPGMLDLGIVSSAAAPTAD